MTPAKTPNSEGIFHSLAYLIRDIGKLFIGDSWRFGYWKYLEMCILDIWRFGYRRYGDIWRFGDFDIGDMWRFGYWKYLEIWI